MANAHLHIVHVFPSFAFGGQQVRFAQIANAFPQGLSHRVIALDGDFEARRLLRDDVEISYEAFQGSKSSIASWATIQGLKAELARSEADLLCTYNWGSIESVIGNAVGPRLPHIHFEDGFGPGEDQHVQAARRVWARRLLLRRARIIVPSTILENIAVNRWKLPKKNVDHFKNGVDLERFSTRREYRASPVTVGSVGALRREKNYHRLISAFADAARASDARLVIVGEGPERPALQAHIEKLGVDDKISLPGQNPSPERSYASFDIFALSSDTEQAPISLLEAMASGLPVVSTHVGDIETMVCDENTPYLVPLGEDERYARALKTMIDDAAKRKSLGTNNVLKAEAAFSLEKMTDAYLDVFRQVAGV